MGWRGGRRICKPSSVSLEFSKEGGHPSRTAITHDLVQPTRGRAEHSKPLLGLAPGGACPPPCYHDRPGALTSRFHPYLPAFCGIAVCFCGAIRRVASPGCYPAPCSVELGLSSPLAFAAERPPDSPAPMVVYQTGDPCRVYTIYSIRLQLPHRTISAAVRARWSSCEESVSPQPLQMPCST